MPPDSSSVIFSENRFPLFGITLNDRHVCRSPMTAALFRAREFSRNAIQN